MISVYHGFYIFVQLQVAPGADPVVAEEATASIADNGRFFHVVSSPGLTILHCPGGRTLLSSRTLQLEPA